jgi:hypothetical protein
LDLISGILQFKEAKRWAAIRPVRRSLSEGGSSELRCRMTNPSSFAKATEDTILRSQLLAHFRAKQLLKHRYPMACHP